MENKISKYRNINSTNNNENTIANYSNNITPKNQKLQISKSKVKFNLNRGKTSEEIKYDNDDEIVLNVKAIKRNKFYKSRQKNKQKKRNLNKDTIEESKNEDVFNQVPENSEKKSKTTKKKVSFLRNYVTIIDVESYKKFNFLNAYEDPYEDALSMFGNINLLNEEDEEDENTRLNCACFIF